MTILRPTHRRPGVEASGATQRGAVAAPTRHTRLGVAVAAVTAVLLGGLSGIVLAAADSAVEADLSQVSGPWLVMALILGAIPVLLVGLFAGWVPAHGALTVAARFGESRPNIHRMIAAAAGVTAAGALLLVRILDSSALRSGNPALDATLFVLLAGALVLGGLMAADSPSGTAGFCQDCGERLEVTRVATLSPQRFQQVLPLLQDGRFTEAAVLAEGGTAATGRCVMLVTACRNCPTAGTLTVHCEPTRRGPGDGRRAGPSADKGRVFTSPIDRAELAVLRARRR